jgi:hypothetical protein
MASEQLPPDDSLRCCNPICRSTATVAVVKTYPGAVPDPHCDQCAVKELMKVPAELGWHVISLADWRERMQPRADEALRMLSRAKTPQLASGPPGVPVAALEAGSPQPESQAPEPPGSPEPPLHRVPWLRIGLISMGLSIPPALIAFAQNGGGTGNPPGPLCLPCALLALALFFWPVIALVIWAIRDIGKEAVAEGKRYAAWKNTLTPEQLNAVRLAELAALMAVQHEVHKRVHSPEAEARRQHVQDQIMHGGF